MSQKTTLYYDMVQNNNHTSKWIKIILILLLSFSFSNTFAQEHNDNDEEKEEKGLNVGDFILGHIGDSYDWHICTIKGKPISIPLLVIVYSKQNGLIIFPSYKFHHGHESYKGFHIAHEGKNKGKIVEISKTGEEVKPFDISITKNVFSLLFSITLILIVFLSVAKKYKKNPEEAPKGLQSWVEPIIVFVRDDIAKSSIGEKKYEKYTPYLLTIFFFIFLNNILGLIPIFPGGANLTGNIAITLVLAIFTFVITTFSGNKAYWKDIFWTPGVPWWLKVPIPLMPIVEIMGVFTKPFVLAVRLFANISAGHIVALGFFSLIFIFGNMSVYAGYGVSAITLIFTIFMSFLELLVAFIQAYVFTLLSALYFGMATEEHH